MQGLLGKKIGMTSVFSEDGKNHTMYSNRGWTMCGYSSKNDETDGYNAVQIGYGENKRENILKRMKGHFKKQNNSQKKFSEFKRFKTRRI